MHYWDTQGRQILDGVAGLWCVNAGHGRSRIVKAIQDQAAEMDFAPPFQMSHPKAFELSERLAKLAPAGMNRVFYTNSGSESVETALKMALAYHRVRGEGTRTRLIGRERGYHGVGFGGISVGGIPHNRKGFGGQVRPGVDHLPHTHNLREAACSRGQPKWGSHLAEDLERLVALHDASNIAAVIVEPVAGSTGVLVPPLGYLQRLRELCTRHGILLVFDEVITGFGRLGAMFGAQALSVVPDMILFAKTVSNGAAPLGGVIVRREIHDALMQGPPHLAELMHGYTCSGHPLACAAGLAMLDVLAEEDLIGRVRELAPHFERTVHALADAPGVISIRTRGLAAGVELAPSPAGIGQRGSAVQAAAFDLGVLTRAPGDTLVLAPPFVSTPAEIEQMVERLRAAIVRTQPEHPEGNP